MQMKAKHFCYSASWVHSDDLPGSYIEAPLPYHITAVQLVCVSLFFCCRAAG